MPVESKDHQVLANYLFPRAGGSKGRREGRRAKERKREGKRERERVTLSRCCFLAYESLAFGKFCQCLSRNILIVLRVEKVDQLTTFVSARHFTLNSLKQP